MNLFLQTAFLISLFGTVASLISGLLVYFLGGEWNRLYGNKAMQARVAFQGLSLFLFLCMLLLR